MVVDHHPIRAALIGCDQCVALGQKVRDAAPVLALCRKLIAAGYDPVLPLHAYRSDTLALKVRSIGEGALYMAGDTSSALRSSAAGRTTHRGMWKAR
jgi:hypothetical protein